MAHLKPEPDESTPLHSPPSVRQGMSTAESGDAGASPSSTAVTVDKATFFKRVRKIQKAWTRKKVRW